MVYNLFPLTLAGAILDDCLVGDFTGTVVFTRDKVLRCTLLVRVLRADIGTVLRDKVLLDGDKVLRAGKVLRELVLRALSNIVLFKVDGLIFVGEVLGDVLLVGDGFGNVFSGSRSYSSPSNHNLF